MILAYKGIDIFYKDEGNGQAIVMLHGFLENSTMWQAFLPELTKKNRVICIDLLGHGKTGCLGHVHSMELMADAVKAVLNHLNIKPCLLIGHSMGGYVALAFAEAYPNAVTRLCLINSTAKADSNSKKAQRDRSIQVVKHNHKLFIRLAISNLFTKKNRTVFKEDIKYCIEQALKTPLQGIIAALEGMKIRPNREKILHAFKHNVTMMISLNDPLLNSQDLITEAKSAQANIVVFQDGHMAPIENKVELLPQLMHFIEY